MQQKTGRNDPCPCGSGKKYKQCCGVGSNQKLLSALPPPMIAQSLRNAWLAIQAGKLNQASAICHQILNVQPNQIDALHLLGIIALRDGDMELAVSFLSKVTQRSPNNPEYFCNLGLAYHEQGKLDLARKHYQKAISLNPRYADAHYNLHAIQLNDIENSIHSLEKVLEINPNDMDARFMLGLLEDYSGRADNAKKHFAILNISPKIYKARLEAWRYLQAHHQGNLPISGSNYQTFEYAIEASKVDGLILEFGVRNGNSIRQIASLVEQEVHGFDSFEGLPEAWHQESKGSYSTHGKLPKVPSHVALHKGWFDQTLPIFLEQNSGNVRLLNIDCDIYSSTKTVLDLLATRIVAGSVLIFDEYIGNEHWKEDEYKAFQEAASLYGWCYQYLCFSMFTKQVALIITKV